MIINNAKVRESLIISLIAAVITGGVLAAMAKAIQFTQPGGEKLVRLEPVTVKETPPPPKAEPQAALKSAKAESPKIEPVKTAPAHSEPAKAETEKSMPPVDPLKTVSIAQSVIAKLDVRPGDGGKFQEIPGKEFAKHTETETSALTFSDAVRRGAAVLRENPSLEGIPPLSGDAADLRTYFRFLQAARIEVYGWQTAAGGKNGTVEARVAYADGTVAVYPIDESIRPEDCGASTQEVTHPTVVSAVNRFSTQRGLARLHPFWCIRTNEARSYLAGVRADGLARAKALMAQRGNPEKVQAILGWYEICEDTGEPNFRVRAAVTASGKRVEL